MDYTKTKDRAKRRKRIPAAHSGGHMVLIGTEGRAIEGGEERKQGVSQRGFASNFQDCNASLQTLSTTLLS